MKSETIELITQYKEGKTIKEFSQPIYAKSKSLSRNEFYSAYGVGLRPNRIFVVHPMEYQLADVRTEDKVYHATHIRFEGELFEIVRTYEVDRFNMEITVK